MRWLHSVAGTSTTEDDMPVPDLFEPVAASAREAARALRAARRGLILAAIAALICLLLADLFGASEDGKTLAAVLGAVAGKSLDVLEARFKWGDRWLAGIAALLALLKLPGTRNWLLARTRSGVATTSTANVATAATERKSSRRQRRRSARTSR